MLTVHGAVQSVARREGTAVPRRQPASTGDVSAICSTPARKNPSKEKGYRIRGLGVLLTYQKFSDTGAWGEFLAFITGHWSKCRGSLQDFQFKFETVLTCGAILQARCQRFPAMCARIPVLRPLGHRRGQIWQERLLRQFKFEAVLTIGAILQARYQRLPAMYARIQVLRPLGHRLGQIFQERLLRQFARMV